MEDPDEFLVNELRIIIKSVAREDFPQLVKLLLWGISWIFELFSSHSQNILSVSISIIPIKPQLQFVLINRITKADNDHTLIVLSPKSTSSAM